MDYTADFQLLAQEVGWNRRNLTDKCKERLSDEMEEVYIHQGIPKALTALSRSAWILAIVMANCSRV